MHFTWQRGQARPLGLCDSSLLLIFKSKWYLLVKTMWEKKEENLDFPQEQGDSDHRGHVMSLPAVDVTNNLTPPSSNGRNMTDSFL